MPGSISETLPRRQFGRRLARMRSDRRIPAPALAPRLGISQPTLSKIENGKLIPSRELLERLATELRLTFVERTELFDAANTMLRPLHRVELAHEQGYSRIQKLVSLLEYESFCCFRLSLVPGPLQTEDYVRSLFCPGGVRASADALRAIAERLGQSQRLTDPSRRYRFLLHESALRTRAAPPSIMVAQLARVLDAMRLPHVEIRLLPQSVDYHSLAVEPPQSSFDILDRALLAVDLNGCWLNMEDGPTVELYTKYFASLWQAAHPGDACRRGLRRIQRDHERMS